MGRIGQISWNKGKKGVMPTPWNKGIKTGKPAWNTGKKLSKEHCYNISTSHLGKIPWNKNLGRIDKKCEICPTIFYRKGKGKHIAKFCSQKCFGLSRRGIPMTNNTKRKISENHKMMSEIVKKIWNNPDYREHMKKVHMGFKHSQETKEKIAETSKEHWKDEVYREKISSKAKGRIPINIFKNQYNKISKPQQNLFNVVQKIFPNAVLNKPLYFGNENARVRFLDIYIPTYHIVFEYDGSYWHNKNQDKIRDDELVNRGLKIIHYVDYIPTEQQIREDLEKIGFEPIVIYRTNEVQNETKKRA